MYLLCIFVYVYVQRETGERSRERERYKKKRRETKNRYWTNIRKEKEWRDIAKDEKITEGERKRTEKM